MLPTALATRAHTEGIQAQAVVRGEGSILAVLLLLLLLLLANKSQSSSSAS
jgi:hypothetical protein